IAPPDVSLGLAPTNIGIAPDGSLYVTYWQGNVGNQGNVLQYDPTNGALHGALSNPAGWFQPRAITFDTTIADAGGPYENQEGQSLTLDGADSYAPDGPPLVYTWNIDGKTVSPPSDSKPTYSKKDATLTLAYSDLQKLGVGTGTHQITLTVNDENGHT